MANEFMARSASDKTEDWPFWMVVRRASPPRNVTREACELVGVEVKPGAVFLSRDGAERVAALANKERAA